jgi:ribosome recycling factor
MIEDLQLIYDEFKSSSNKTLEHLDFELTKIRAGKASPSMLQGVMVEYYGTMTPISKVANVGTLDARTITVQAWEKNVLNDISRGIINANLGFAPQNNGEMLIINVPPLNEERRRDLVKRAKAEGENGKVIIRNHRKDAMDMIKDLKNDGLSEDLVKSAEIEIQNITNVFVKKIDDLIELKEKDIVTI